MANEQILVVEDDSITARFIQDVLECADYQVTLAHNGSSAISKMEEHYWDLVLLDYIMPGQDGFEVLAEANRRNLGLPILFMTAHGTIENAVAAMKLGATDYMIKPLEPESLLLKVRSVLEVTALRRQVGLARSEAKQRHGFENVASSGPPMDQVIALIKTIARSEAETILLLGGSGVGKNLIAQTIHYNSARADNPFVTVTCTAIPENLLESELFGHEKGAFTDAKKTRRGLLEMADGGTVFLDEIGDMPLSLQAKLLGFLENRVCRRVGASSERRVNVRVVTATNKDLKEAVNTREFRSDLYYRLNVIEISIPPLRERINDLPLIVYHFISHYNKKFNKQVAGLNPAALPILQAYTWPGNVRELKNVVERAMILTNNAYLTLDDFPAEITQSLVDALPVSLVTPKPMVPTSPATPGPSPGLDMKTQERHLIEQALERTEGNQSRAAVLLGITRNQLVYRLKKHNLRSS